MPVTRHFAAITLAAASWLAVGPLCAQTQQNMPAALGYSTFTCHDIDGDGYGTGPQTIVLTGLTSATSPGTQTVTPVSMSGTSSAFTGSQAWSIYAGEVLWVDNAPNREQIIVQSVTATTFTATFVNSHASSAIIFDGGCPFGKDADDNDPNTNTPASVLSNYGSIDAFLGHLGYPNNSGYAASFQGPWSSTTTYTTGQSVSYQNKVYSSLANGNINQIPSASNQNWATVGYVNFQGDWNSSAAYSTGQTVLLSGTGMIYAATQASTNQSPPTSSYWAYVGPSLTWYISSSGTSNTSCGEVTSPCATYAQTKTNQKAANANVTVTGGLVTLWRGAGQLGNGGYLEQVLASGGSANNLMYYMSYPGEFAVLAPAGSATSNTNLWTNLNVGYYTIDGLGFTGHGGYCLEAGTSATANNAPQLATNITIKNTEVGGIPADRTSGCSEGGIYIMNGISNLTIEDTVTHDEECSSCAHNYYIGTRQLISSNITFVRNIGWNTYWNVLHVNGQFPNSYYADNLAYSAGISCFDFENGTSNSLITYNLGFNCEHGVTIYNYLAQGLTYATNYQGSWSSTVTYSLNQSVLSGGNVYVATGSNTNQQPPNSSYWSLVGTGTNDCNVTPDQAGCPAPQVNNVIDHNTLVNTGNSNLDVYNNATFGSECTGYQFCKEWPIIINAHTGLSTPQADASQFSQGGNTFTNNIIVGYGDGNTVGAIGFGDPITVQCDANCVGWMQSTIVQNNLFYQSDGNETGTLGGVAVLQVGPASQTKTYLYTNTSVLASNGGPFPNANWVGNSTGQPTFLMTISPPAISAALTANSATAVTNALLSGDFNIFSGIGANIGAYAQPVISATSRFSGFLSGNAVLH